MKVLLTLLFFLSTNIYAGLIKKEKSFKISPAKVGKDIHYNATFYKKDVSKEVNTFDAEKLSKKANTVIAFFKSALIVDQPINHLDLTQFEESVLHAKMLDATILKEYSNEQDKWRMSMKIAIKTITFDYKTYQTSTITKNQTINAYITAADELDTYLPPAEHYFIQYLDKCSQGVDKMITITKLIPYGNKTLAVSYQLTRFNKKWYQKFNIFSAVKRIFTKKLTQTIEKTKNFLKN